MAISPRLATRILENILLLHHRGRFGKSSQFLRLVCAITNHCGAHHKIMRHFGRRRQIAVVPGVPAGFPAVRAAAGSDETGFACASTYDEVVGGACSPRSEGTHGPA